MAASAAASAGSCAFGYARAVVDRPVSVVFVHGLRSSADTWSQFVRLIQSDADLDSVRLHTFEYATAFFSFHPARRIPTFNDIADSLRTFLECEIADGTDLVLVSHSQGGLVVQRYLARMLADGRGRDLARIRRIVMFACPNAGSQIFALARRAVFGRRNPQERELRPLEEAITDTQRTVLTRVVNATDVAPDHCRIQIYAYAGESDGVVTPASARSVFPDVGVLPGDHFSIIEPDSHQHRSYAVLKRHLLQPSWDERVPQPRISSPDPTVSPADRNQVLVDGLLRVQGMTDPQFRSQLYDLLPDVIVNSLPRTGNPRLELFALVRSFDRFGHLGPWRELARALAALAPEQQPVLELNASLVRFGLLTARSADEPDPREASTGDC